MQTVSLRLAQVRCICKCPSCLLGNNAITRQATTATARRTVRVGNIFTVSLSSVAAGLAFADSKKKDDRRKKWDEVIGEAKATLEATEIQQQNRLAALSNTRVRARKDSTIPRHDTAAEKAVEEVEAWVVQEREGHPHTPPILDFVEASEALVPWVPLDNNRRDTWVDVFHWAREQHKVREASGFQDWKGPPLDLLQSLSWRQLHDLVSDKRLLSYFYRGPDCNSLVWTPSACLFPPRKTRVLEWSIAKMVLKLLVYSSSSQPQEYSISPTATLLHQLLGEESIRSKLNHLQERLDILEANSARYMSSSYYVAFERPPVPNYDAISEEEYERPTEMNTSLRSLLKLMKSGMDLSDLISKTCYNLLTARIPPNTHTYNMLLLRFCLLGMDKPVKAVLTSMRESHIRPNEITHATLLRHFTVTGDRAWFVEYLWLMEGRLRGQSLAHPEREIPLVLMDRHHIFGEYLQKAAEKARMNSQVYESLIVGLIRFRSFDNQIAMHYYRCMISEGWSPSLGIWLVILQDCCRTLDWTVGEAVLEHLERTAEKIDTVTYEWMLRLCQRCKQQQLFDEILIKGVHCGALPASMMDLPDHAKAEDISYLIEKAQDRQSCKATGMKTPGESTKMRSRHLGDESPFQKEVSFHECEDEDTLRRTIARTKQRSMARLDYEERLRVIAQSIASTVLQVRRALSASESASFHKFCLSRRVKSLNQNLMQNPHSDAYAAYNEAVSIKIHKTEAEYPNICRRYETRGKSPRHFTRWRDDGTCAIHRLGRRESPIDSLESRDSQGTAYPPSISPWENPKEQVATAASHQKSPKDVNLQATDDRLDAALALRDRI